MSQVLHVKNNIHIIHRHRTAGKGTGPLSNVFNACRQTSSSRPHPPPGLPPVNPTPSLPLHSAQPWRPQPHKLSWRLAERGRLPTTPRKRKKKRLPTPMWPRCLPYKLSPPGTKRRQQWKVGEDTFAVSKRNRARVVNGPCAPLLYRLHKRLVGRSVGLRLRRDSRVDFDPTRHTFVF